MRRLLASSALLLLGACAPLDGFDAPAAPRPDGAPSSAAADTGSGTVEATPEPFVDPLAPAALTGAVTVEERAHSGALVAIGSPRARVAMDVFLNPESPYSREFQRSRMPAVVSEFVTTGKLAVRLHILPIRKYGGSASAARAVSCAASQGKGYPAFDVLLREGRADLDDGDVAELGLDAASYRSCVQTGTDDPFETASGTFERWDVTLVPTYVIHDERFVGLPTEADLLGAIREYVR